MLGTVGRFLESDIYMYLYRLDFLESMRLALFG